MWDKTKATAKKLIKNTILYGSAILVAATLLDLALYTASYKAIMAVQLPHSCPVATTTQVIATTTAKIAPVQIKAWITAYSEKDSCHYKNCVMASGKRAYIGAVACPRNIKFGTRVVIDNKPYVCEDRVSKLYPERFDIFMGYGEQAYKNAKQFGKQQKTIEFSNN